MTLQTTIAQAASTTTRHQFGQALPPGESIETWTRHAGMDWRILEAPVRYAAEGGESGETQSFPDHKVLYRSDTREALSVVGSRYQVVQPREVLEFYRDLTEVSGFELETAGVFKFGRKFWALARTGKSVTLKRSDVVQGYLLLATSCDGTLATTAAPTTIRVVCENTLNIAVRDAVGAVKVPHRTSFDAQAVKRQLGVAVSQWDNFMYRMKGLSSRQVKSQEAMNYFLKVICQADSTTEGQLANERALKKVQALYDGRGRGAELAAAKGTAWGLLNAVTEYVDHERRARSTEHRLDSAWFGQGALIKARALEYALQMTM